VRRDAVAVVSNEIRSFCGTGIGGRSRDAEADGVCTRSERSSRELVEAPRTGMGELPGASLNARSGWSELLDVFRCTGCGVPRAPLCVSEHRMRAPASSPMYFGAPAPGCRGLLYVPPSTRTTRKLRP